MSTNREKSVDVRSGCEDGAKHDQPMVKYQREPVKRRKICAPYFLTMLAPIPCTARNSASLLGAVVAILSSARSPKILNAGTRRRLASPKRHARNACSMRFCSDPDTTAVVSCFPDFDRDAAVEAPFDFRALF